MTLSYINGLQVGDVSLGSASTFDYGYAHQHVKRLLYLWLKKVVGWTEHDIRGGGSWGAVGNWDNPLVSLKTDGATDSSDVRKFTSATALFITNGVTEQDYLFVRPASAPTPTGGFTDPTRNGFYRILRVVSESEIWVETWNGVHTDGLPLSESGLNFEIHRFTGTSHFPTNGDQWVMEGTGIGGTFHLRQHHDYAYNYGGGVQFDISPWPDWDNVGHAWLAAPPRHTTFVNNGCEPYCDVGWIWAIADLTHVIIFVRYYNTGFSAQDIWFMYAGDIEAFHPTQDTRPVVILNQAQNSSWNVLTQTSNRWVDPDGTTERSTVHPIYHTQYAGNSGALGDNQRRNRSYHSQRFVRWPVILAEDVAGGEELRGQLKSLRWMSNYSLRMFTPFGAARDQICLSDYLAMPWNGSKQNRWVA